MTDSSPLAEVKLPATGSATKDGPWPGCDPYTNDGPTEFELAAPVTAGAGTISLWIRQRGPIFNGPDVETDGGTIVELPGFGKVNIWWYSGYGGIVWETEEGIPGLPVEVPGLPGPQWLHLCYTWDAAEGRMDGYINGTPIRLAGTRVKPWSADRSASKILVNASRWDVAGLRIGDRSIAPHEVLALVPSVYRGALDHTLGSQHLGSLDADAWRGETLFENPLDGPDKIDGWRMEGPGEVAFKDGWMRMWSTTPDIPGKEGHIVHWCDQDLPADFLLEFDVRIINETGLNIIFFCAKGRNGEDALDPSLSERTGIFGHYTMGDLNCYHVSYYAHTPGGGGRSTSNLRKNHGFYLVDNGPIGIPPEDHGVHHVALLKIGGTIQLGVDGRRVIDWHDDGRQYGPVWGEGKIALRQMKWTTAEYQNLKVSAVRT